MTEYDRKPLLVYSALLRQNEICNLGEKHEITVNAIKLLGPVIGVRIYDNGYERLATDLRQDAQGRTYHKHIQIDYHSNVSWRRDEDGARFYTRPQGHPARDILGRLLNL